MFDFDPLGGPNTKIVRGEKTASGDSNGLSLVVDTEAYDHGYAASSGFSRPSGPPIYHHQIYQRISPLSTAGVGASAVVHHHGDQPLLMTNRIMLSVRI